MLAGRASYLSLARLLPAAGKAFEELVTRYPETPNVHYVVRRVSDRRAAG